MAEESEGKKKSPLIKNLVLFAVALLVPAVIGLVIAKMWLLPTLSGETHEEEHAEALEEPFPAGMTDVPFDELNISVQTDDPNTVAPLLMVQVALSCENPETAEKVTEKKSYFAAEILKYHQGRTRAELNDPMVQNSILEQIKQQSNILLKKMKGPEAKEEMKVLRVMYLKFSIMDM